MGNQTFGYITELSSVKFDDDADVIWMQAIPVGKYDHPRYGELDITPQRVVKFAQNINNNVRGQKLDIDYEHKENPAEGGRAAGWVEGAQARADGLWIGVKFTDRAKKAIQDGEYRYFSPELTDVWTHPKTGAIYEDVMFGGGLTNRPFLKDILPINLSEYVKGGSKYEEGNDPPDDPNKGVKMDELLTKLRALFGLDDKADEAAVVQAAEQLKKTGEDANTELTTVKAEVASLSEAAGVKTLAEVKPVIEEYKKMKAPDDKAKKFAEMFPEEAKQLEEQRQAIKLAEVEKKVAVWSKHPTSKKGIPAKLTEAVKTYRMSVDGDAASKFDEFMDKLMETGTVDFSERGSGSTEPFDDPEVEFEGLIKKYSEEKKVSFRDAVAEVSREHPELARAWQQKRSVVSSGGGE